MTVQPASTPDNPTDRCPHCDSRLSPGATHCLLCGAAVAPSSFILPPSSFTGTAAPPPPTPSVAATPAPKSGRRKRGVSAVTWMVIITFLVTFALGALIVQNPAPVELALFPSLTPIPPTPTLTPTWTPLPTETSRPTDTPTITPVPPPTDTPPPPRFHRVESGETLFGLGLRYEVSADSIAQANNLPAAASIQVGQNLLIPYPTATPPLAPVALQIGEETCVADPTGCELFQIQSGDSLFSIAGRLKVNLDALIQVNRLTDQAILQPGDTLCIPKLVCGGVLPPTPGPSPTPTSTLPPPGPYLLYPAAGAAFESVEQVVALQWAAVKDLAADEWYMVEATDLTAVDSHPLRAFTRQNSFQLPSTWRPAVPELHYFRWRVSIVRVTGRRADGAFIYTYGGTTSQDSDFYWLGVVPTPTPTVTPTATLNATGNG
ncbi:MAG: LysM peptidoglycan-binding domain-containing protein [Chloroflexota bacterium]